MTLFLGQKGHTKVKVELVRDIDLESVPVMFGTSGGAKRARRDQYLL